MGTVSTTVTANWTVIHDATVSGDDVTVTSGEAWSDVDLMDAIPDGATITDLTFSLTAEITGSRQTPETPCAPRLQFIDKAEYLAATYLFGYGIFGAGGVGDLPDDNDPHFITYDNNTYGSVSGGGGITDMDAFAAALSNASTPVILAATGPQTASTGSSITYSAPLTITFTYTEFLPCDTDVDLDLSTAVFLDNSGTLSGQYVDGVICTTTDFLSPDFYFPDLVLDATSVYKVTVTYDSSSSHTVGTGREVYVAGVHPGSEQDDVDTAFAAGGEYEGTVPVLWDTGFSTSGDIQSFVMGPGRGPGPVTDDVGDLPSWDDATVGVAQGFTAPWFETDPDAAVSAITIRKLCTFVIPPLRQYPRSDGLGASTVRRLWPPPPTIQASNRRGPSAIL